MAKRRAIKAGSAFVEFFADDDGLRKGLRRASARLDRFGEQARRFGTGAAAAGAGLLAPVIGSLVALARVGDELDKLSIRTGISVEALSELRLAANRSGSDIDELGNAILRMNRRVGRIRAGQGTATQADALSALGLDAAELDVLSPIQTFEALADAIANMEDKTAAAGLAQRAFGTQVDAILPLLLQGSDGIAQLRKEARELGLTVSGEVASQAAELTDAFGDLGSQITILGVAFGSTIAPAITAVATALAPLNAVMIGIASEVPIVAQSLVIAGGALVAIGSAGLAVAVTSKLAAISLGGLATAAGLLQTALLPVLPIILPIAFAVGVLVVVLDKFFGIIGRIIRFIQRFIGIGGSASETSSALEQAKANLEDVGNAARGAGQRLTGSFSARTIERNILPDRDDSPLAQRTDRIITLMRSIENKLGFA